MKGDLTKGPVMKSMLLFAMPMILGNMLQQCYNVADTLIVGRFLGPDALAAVGSAFSLMTFLTSIILGLCMGSGALFSIRFGQRDLEGMRESVFASFLLIGAVAVAINLAVFFGIDWILVFLQVPDGVTGLMREYLIVIFYGIFATFLYNYFASLLRAVGNSVVPLVFLAVSAVLNIALDLWFVVGLDRGVAGAAEATVTSQYVSGIGTAAYTFWKRPDLLPRRKNCALRMFTLREIARFSFLTCLQQSVMNLGILLVQGRVNSFGPGVMAAFAATVKIDAFAYMPVQDFGNAFSTFIAQNYGAGMDLCPAPDAVVCGRRRDRHHRRGRPVSAYRGSLLLWYRLPLPLLRPLPGDREAGDFRGAHCHFPGNPRRPGLSALRHSGCRGCGDLVVRAHRLAAGGPGRCPLSDRKDPTGGGRKEFQKNLKKIKKVLAK